MISIKQSLKDKVGASELFGVLSLLCAFSPLARGLVYGFPLASLGLGLYYILRKARERYIQLVLWLYMFTPLLHRMVDQHLGAPETPLMTAPYLVSAVAAIPLMMNASLFTEAYIAPLFCVALSIVYGAMITVVHAPPLLAIQGSVAWLLPLCGCGYIYSQRRFADQMFKAFVSAMVTGTFLIGLYGLIQYFLLPDWDRVWMEVSELVAFGSPAPFEVRVFSTMNAPQITGAFLAVGLIFTYWSQSRLKYVSMIAGVGSLALTISRAAWVSFVCGFLLLFIKLPNRDRAKVVLAAGIVLIVLLGGLAIPAVNDTLAPRFQSLTDVKHDDSANARVAIYSGVLDSLGRSPFGFGIGVENDGSGNGSMSDAEHDSTAINLLLSFGVVGTIAFCSGLAILLWRVARYAPLHRGSIQALPAVVVALLAESLLNNIITGPIAFLLWIIIGFGCAFDQRQRSALAGAPASMTQLAGQ